MFLKDLQKNNFQSGFTLIEVIIYIGILVLILATVGSVTFSFFSNRNRIEAHEEVSKNMSFVMNKISHEIKNADSVISPITGESSELVLDKGKEIKFDKKDSKIRITRASKKAVPLNSDKVEITNLRFVNLSQSGQAGTIRVEADVKSQDTSFGDYVLEEDFYTTATVRADSGNGGGGGGDENWLSNWQYRKKITIDASDIDSSLNDFPVVVFLNSGNFDFDKALDNGYDIRFTREDGSTELNFERELHSSSSEEGVYHVKLPSVSSNSSTIFYVYYGNSSASDASDPESVWGSDQVLVQHLQESSGDLMDSSSYSNNGVSNGSVSKGVMSKVGRGIELDGSSYVEIDSSDSLTVEGENITFSAWAKWTIDPGSGDNWASIMNKGSSGWNPHYELKHARKNDKFEATVFSDNSKWVWSNTVPSVNDWYYLTGSYDGSELRIYVNGQLENSKSMSGSLNSDLGENLYLGAVNGSYRYFEGIIDEVRVSDVTKSENWIDVNYKSQNDSLLSYGEEQSY